MTSGIPPRFQTFCSRMGSAFVMLRAGFSIQRPSLVAAGAVVPLVALLPLACEIAVHGALALGLFGDYTNTVWPFLQAAVAAPCAAALLVPTVLQLRSKGHRGTRGTPLVLSVACGPDTALGVWAGTFLSSILFLGDESSMAVAVGTIAPKLIGGLIAGAIIAVVWDLLFVFFLLNEARPYTARGAFWLRHNNAVAQTSWLAMLLTACSLIYTGYLIDSPAAGVMGAFSMGVTSSMLLWYRAMAVYPDDSRAPMAIYKRLTPLAPVAVSDLQQSLVRLNANFWDYWLMPWLFSMTISGIRLASMFEGAFFWRAVLCILGGAAARILATAVATLPLAMTWKERLFTGAVFTARATDRTRRPQPWR
jgi:hypothetical protein